MVHFNRYEPVPETWQVIVADIVNSTQAIEAGKYKQVNVLGAAIITAVCKLFHPHSIPYIFAGDGVFLCTPRRHQEEIRRTLAHIRRMAEDTFGLDQVSGIIPVSDIRSNNKEVRVAKFAVSKDYFQASFEGEGLNEAEKLLRNPDTSDKYQVKPSMHPETDLSNLECRWDHMESIHDEIICVLVKVTGDNEREEIYRNVIATINRLYCEEFVCKPVREEDVQLTFEWDKLSVEYKIRTYGKSWLEKLIYFLKLMGMQLAGKILLRFGISGQNTDWSRYKHDLERNTDYRKFDDMVREVLSGTIDQRKRLQHYLENLYREGKIVYGLHHAPSVMVTCMVMNYDREHFHFVDGSAGGYAAAAADLKRRLKKLRGN